MHCNKNVALGLQQPRKIQVNSAFILFAQGAARGVNAARFYLSELGFNFYLPKMWSNLANFSLFDKNEIEFSAIFERNHQSRSATTAQTCIWRWRPRLPCYGLVAAPHIEWKVHVTNAASATSASDKPGGSRPPVQPNACEKKAAPSWTPNPPANWNLFSMFEVCFALGNSF